MQHRDDIDGLRAVSIAAVVLYHAAPSLVPSGFYGVDVFFVISGYLITGILYSEASAGRPSLLYFYARRARRILPALVVVCAVSTLAAVILLFPNDLMRFAWDLMASAAFVANVHFYLSTNYFAPPPDTSPLLHLWSLAVEEQFYVLFPLVILLAFKVNRVMTVLVGIFAASLIAFLYLGPHDPQAVFYLLPYRAWELMLGSVTAALAARLPPPPKPTIALAWLGAGAIGFAFMRHTPVHPAVPGVGALLACLGTAGILAFNFGRFALAPLSWRPVVFVGLISYSLYLWHWPVLTFAHYYFMGPLSAAQITSLVAASFILAALTWYFVEQPLRRMRLPTARLFSYSAASLAALALGGVVIVSTDGLPWRIKSEALEIANYPGRSALEFNLSIRLGECFIDLGQKQTVYNSASCMDSRGSRHTLALWGDSYAAHLYPGLTTVLGREGFRILQATASSCPPILEEDFGTAYQCRTFNRFFFEQIAASKPEIVGMSANWVNTTNDKFVALDKTIEALKSLGIKVVIFGQAPIYDAPLPQIISRYIQANKSFQDAPLLPERVMAMESFMADRYGRMPGVHYLSLINTICKSRVCRTSINGIPMARDHGHLTSIGSEFIALSLRDDIVALLPKSASVR